MKMDLPRKLAALSLFFMTPSGAAQSTFTLRTADTTLRAAAAPNGPELLDLRANGGTIWKNRATEALPRSVEIAGKVYAIEWHWNQAETRSTTKEISLVYDSAAPKLRFSWEWMARANAGPLEHRIRLENLGDQELWAPMIDSLRFDWECATAQTIEHFFVEKGAGSPSKEGTHLVNVGDGYRWEGRSSTYAQSEAGEAREIIPWMLVERADGLHSGWYVGIEFSGRTRLTLARKGTSLSGTVGLNPNPGPFKTRVAPGKAFETPEVFLGSAVGGPDAAGNVLRRWVKSVLLNPADRHNPDYPALVNNSWGSGMQVDEALALRMLKGAAELKFDMFHLDAGWFRGVGDWYPDPKKFPNGLAPIAEEAHRLGLKFGLWVDWTQAGLNDEPGALNVRDPKVNDWAVADTPPDWKPQEFKGQTIDLGVPAAQAWAEQELQRIITDYQLDMLEHDAYLVAQGCTREDHPHAPPDPRHLIIKKLESSFDVESSNSTDVSLHAVRAYYAIYSELRKKYPGLLLEICNDGGRMVDFGSAAHGDYFSITDAYDPVTNRRAFYDASFVLPPGMLEAYVEKWPTRGIEKFRYMLRSGMMGWLTIMQDTTAWSPEQRAAAQSEFELYKSTLRSFIRDADLYHVSSRPDGIGWDGIEYFDAAKDRGVLFVFRGSGENDATHHFPLWGAKSGQRYELRFRDNSQPPRTVLGAELLQHGLNVTLRTPDSSEIVFVDGRKGEEKMGRNP